jgi:hypothetical protein
VVPDPRAPLGARAVRSVSGPRPIGVQTDAMGQPVAVQRRGWPGPIAVARVQDRWMVEDEWWREHPIGRFYHTLLLEDGSRVEAYYDMPTERWYEASAPLRRLEPERGAG